VSDSSQGSGWWLASDGKWYPPQAAAPAAPTAPTAGTAPAGATVTAPVGTAPPGAIPGQAVPGQAPPVAPSSSGRGCLMAVLIGLAVIFVLAVGAFVVFGFIVNRVAHKVIGTQGPCPFLSNADAAASFGAGTTVQRLEGLSKVLVIIDARVMPNDPSCAISRDDPNAAPGASSSSGGIGRVARYQGSAASAKYQAELTKAKGVSEDRGNGITVTSENYYNKDVSGLGDQAFCTTSSGVGAGVLTRKGDTLVYVSVVADVNTVPGIDTSDPNHPKLGTDDVHCELAQRLARQVLRS
jgi:hypothetical protein